MNPRKRITISIVTSCLFVASIFLFADIVPSISASTAEFSSELVFESSLATHIADLQQSPSGDFYYSSLGGYSVLGFDSESRTETTRFSSPSDFVDKFVINRHSGDLYFIGNQDNSIEVIYDYMNAQIHSPSTTLDVSPYISHSTVIKALAVDPTDPDSALYFSTVGESSSVSGLIYRVRLEPRRIEIFINVQLDGGSGRWDGEFTFDRFGNLYIAQGSTSGIIYRFNTSSSDFSVYYSPPSSVSITSICFDQANILHYTGGDNRVYRLVSLAQAYTDYTHDEPLDIAIIFVGYDQGLINTAEIDSKLPHYGSVSLGAGEKAYYSYQVSYACHFADQSYKQAIDAFVANHSQDDPTVQLDIAALEHQAEFWEPQDIFFPKNGTAIDGNALEIWLDQNRYVPKADYCIYLLNFSYFDTGERDHWFEVMDIDGDTGINKHWYRNEFDFPWNLDAEFPYAGYTGYESPDIYLDPYSFQWYLKWREIWNFLNINDGNHEFYDEDLDHFILTHDPSTSSGKTAINDYIGDWLAEIVPISLFWDPVNRIDYSDDISVQVKIFNGVSSLGFSNDDLEWTVNETTFLKAYEELLPGSSIVLEVEFLDLLDYPGIQQLLDYCHYSYSPATPPIDDYTYYNGYALFSSLFSSLYIQQFFDLTAADLVVTGYAFVLDNASFGGTDWAGGGLYTGLGGGGRTLQLMELDRLYYPNRTTMDSTPRQGFSKVLVHETGHAIGFPHTFTTTQYAPDFTGDTMGYYGGFSRFSCVRIESFQRYAAEQEIFMASMMAQDHMLDDTEAPWLVYLQSAWDSIAANYSEKNYVEARKSAMEFQQLLVDGPFEVPPILTTTKTTTTNTTTETTSKPLKGFIGVELLVPVVLVVVTSVYKKNRKNE
ncbi:MAG: hypothetical protein ACFFD4_01205 [Candidatus Odinarchaeota archaeon]